MNKEKQEIKRGIKALFNKIAPCFGEVGQNTGMNFIIFYKYEVVLLS